MQQLSRYRLQRLLDFNRNVAIPSLTLALLLRGFQAELGFLSLPAHLVFIFAWGSAAAFITSTLQAREMRRMGGRPIPRVQGKWPGNIDILLRMLRAFKTSYILDVYLDLFKEYQCTTLNTRLLWFDTVSNLVLQLWGTTDIRCR
jgi:hypothetical protein